MKNGYRIAAVGICALVLAVVFAPTPGGSRWIHTLHDSAHAPIFGCVAVLSLLALRSSVRFASLSAPLQYVAAFAVAGLLGLGTEVVQSFTGRDASWSDLARDIGGAAAFLLLFSALDRTLGQKPRSVRALSAGVAVVTMGLLAVPLVDAAIQYERRSERFPVLADFTAGVNRFFVFRNSVELTPIELPPRWRHAKRESALRVQFVSGPYPGVEFAEPMPDWSAYSTFALDVTNPTHAPLQLVVRIHDAQHDKQFADRFNRTLELAPGTRRVFRIPLEEVAAAPATRRLDLRHVTGLILFRTPTSRAGEMYVSRLWLE